MEQLPALYEVATAFHSCRDVDSLLKTLARKVAERLSARAVLVWMSTAEGEEEGLRLHGSWFEAGTRFEAVDEAVEEGILAEGLEAGHGRRLGGKEIDADEFVHLSEDDRERVRSAAYGVLRREDEPAGVVEVLNKHAGEFTAEELAIIRLKVPELPDK
ncbi:MAG: GAF domain-containing protein, partial [Chloroflexota bacterium]